MTDSALVTGAASGLGAATAARLERDGLHVVRLDRVAAPGVETGDVTDAADVGRAIAVATAQGPLRVCVTCAGIASATRILGAAGVHDLEAFRRTVEVNLVGTFNTLRLAAAAMATNEPDADGQRGVIVLTASIAAFDGQIGQAAYAASKAGIVGLTLPAARRFSPGCRRRRARPSAPSSRTRPASDGRRSSPTSSRTSSPITC
jgi:NAD(P)-dependent dehydrogenase (short-subunit alcohol dehydrogenase family)